MAVVGAGPDSYAVAYVANIRSPPGAESMVAAAEPVPAWLVEGVEAVQGGKVAIDVVAVANGWDMRALMKHCQFTIPGYLRIQKKKGKYAYVRGPPSGSAYSRIRATALRCNLRRGTAPNMA